VRELVGGFVDVDAPRPRVFQKLFDQVSVHLRDSSTRVLRWRMLSCHKGTKSQSSTKKALWTFASWCLRGELFSTRNSPRHGSRRRLTALAAIRYAEIP
jgi:hypothetical protein